MNWRPCVVYWNVLWEYGLDNINKRPNTGQKLQWLGIDIVIYGPETIPPLNHEGAISGHTRLGLDVLVFKQFYLNIFVLNDERIHVWIIFLLLR